MPHQKTRKQRRRGLSSLTKRRGGGGLPSVRIPHSGRAGYLLQGGGNPFLLDPEWKWERKRICRWIAKDTCMQSVLRLVQQNGSRQESRLKKDPPTYRHEYEDPPIPVNHDSQKPSHLHISVVAAVSEIALHHQDSGGAVLSLPLRRRFPPQFEMGAPDALNGTSEGGGDRARPGTKWECTNATGGQTRGQRTGKKCV